jgi:hypothetical protein
LCPKVDDPQAEQKDWGRRDEDRAKAHHDKIYYAAKGNRSSQRIFVNKDGHIVSREVLEEKGMDAKLRLKGEGSSSGDMSKTSIDDEENDEENDVSTTLIQVNRSDPGVKWSKPLENKKSGKKKKGGKSGSSKILGPMMTITTEIMRTTTETGDDDDDDGDDDDDDDDNAGQLLRDKAATGESLQLGDITKQSSRLFASGSKSKDAEKEDEESDKDSTLSEMEEELSQQLQMKLKRKSSISRLN